MTCGCDNSCNSDCGCGSTHHHCGCPCHATPAGIERYYARNERVMLAAAAEVERLKPIVGAKLGCEQAETIAVTWGGDLHERDIEWHAWPIQGRGGQHTNGGHNGGVLAYHRPTGIATTSTEHRSQLRNKDAAFAQLRVIVEAHKRPAAADERRIGNLLTAEEWGALNALGVCLDENHVYRFLDAATADGQSNRSTIRRAVAKLFAANAGRVL